MEGGCGDVDNSCDFFFEWNGGAATGNNLPDVDELQQGNYSGTVRMMMKVFIHLQSMVLLEQIATDLVNQSCSALRHLLTMALKLLKS